MYEGKKGCEAPMNYSQVSFDYVKEKDELFGKKLRVNESEYERMYDEL